MFDDVADSIVEALDPTVRLRVLGRSQSVLDAHGQAHRVECMLARRRLCGAGEAVGELAAVVGEDRLDPHRRSPLEPTQEVGTALVGLVAVAAHEDPSRGAVDSHEEVAPVGLIGHLRQVLDVDVQEAGLVLFEGLMRLGLALDLRTYP